MAVLVGFLRHFRGYLDRKKSLSFQNEEHADQSTAYSQSSTATLGALAGAGLCCIGCADLCFVEDMAMCLQHVKAIEGRERANGWVTSYLVTPI